MSGPSRPLFLLLPSDLGTGCKLVAMVGGLLLLSFYYFLVGCVVELLVSSLSLAAVKVAECVGVVGNGWLTKRGDEWVLPGGMNLVLARGGEWW